MRSIITSVFLILFSQDVLAYCMEPSAPYSKPDKPTVPFCVNEWAGTHTCSDWEIESYYSDIRNYNYEVESYVNDLQNYLYDAEDYVRCEINSLNY